jgi:hypothetical protein
MRFVWLGACVCWLAVAAAPGFAQATGDDPPEEQAPRPAADAGDLSSIYNPPNLNVDSFPPEARQRVRAVVEQPTLAAHGPLEIFTCKPDTYRWLMDHPDKTVKLWRRLGAKCMEIQDQGDGRFGWKEGVSDVHWEVVRDGPHQRVWYAEGLVKPALLIPAVPFKAVLVLDYMEGKDGSGKPAVRHQMRLILHTDSRAVALAARIMGASAPKMAEEFLGQLQMFYAAMAWYLDQHPDRADKMFAALQQPDPPGTRLTAPIRAAWDGEAPPADR